MLKECNIEDRDYLGDAMSNFDHSIEKNIAEELKQPNTYAGYPAWDFHGTVWFEDGIYYCEIYRYHCHIDTINDVTLEGIMEQASDKYGYN